MGEESRQRGLKTLTDLLSPSYYAEAQLMLTDRPFAGCVLNRVPLGKHPYYYAPYHNAKYEAYYVSS